MDQKNLFVNLANLDNIELLNKDNNVPPCKIYLVEDINGVHGDIWRERVRPYLQDITCRIVYVGATNDRFSRN